MMGIYIKGMKMPTHCMDCPFMVSRDNDDCILQSDEANEGFKNWEQMKDGCPLVPVPPHGRLIDADAFAAKIIEIIEQQGYDDAFAGSLTIGEILRDVVHELKGDGVNGFSYAPTVIEAEEGE